MVSFSTVWRRLRGMRVNGQQIRGGDIETQFSTASSRFDKLHGDYFAAPQRRRRLDPRMKKRGQYAVSKDSPAAILAKSRVTAGEPP